MSSRLRGGLTKNAKGDICSLCCSVEKDCHDSCKTVVLIDLTDKAVAARASAAQPAW